MTPHLAFKIAQEDTLAAGRMALELVGAVMADDHLHAKGSGQAKIMARRILLKALIALDPEYKVAAKSLLETEFNLSDYEQQWLSYCDAADDLARIASAYHDMEYGE